MVRYCSVPQCSTYCTEPGVNFHRYPEDDAIRKEWLVRLRNGKEPSKYAMVCSKHFDKESFKLFKNNTEVRKRRKLKENAVPTMNLPRRKFDVEKQPRKPPVNRIPFSAICNPQTGVGNSGAGLDAMPQSQVHQNASDAFLSGVATALSDCGLGADECQHDTPTGERSMEVPPEDILQQFASIVSIHAGALRDACVQADPQLESGRQKPLLSYSAVQDEHKIRILTGLVSVQLMENIIAEYSALRKLSVPRGFALSDEDTVLMVFVKLYHNVNFSFLSVLFSIHRTTVSNILRYALCILARVLGEAVFFPSKESVMDNITIYFKQYKQTRVVLDCTEVAIERPGDLRSRLLTYSQYKKQYTLKVLIGCAPSGMITVVGEGYGGRSSDSQLTARSNVLEKCMPYVDHIMVDKGFLIENLCDDARIRMDRPPFLKKRRQMEEQEAIQNQAIARARVHVERAIQRLKAFRILQHKFPLQLLPVFNKVLLVLAGVANLSRPILAEDKFLPNC